jgi:hypothetical protein
LVLGTTSLAKRRRISGILQFEHDESLHGMKEFEVQDSGHIWPEAITFLRCLRDENHNRQIASNSDEILIAVNFL